MYHKEKWFIYGLRTSRLDGDVLSSPRDGSVIDIRLVRRTRLTRRLAPVRYTYIAMEDMNRAEGYEVLYRPHEAGISDIND